MYCNNCGVEIDNEKTLCKECEENQPTLAKTVEENNSQINADTKQFIFRRHKSLGKLDISYIVSEINICSLTMKLKQQKINFYIFKKKATETIHSVKDFTSIKIVRTLDISDGIFALIFALLGILNPAFLIVAAILLWVGFGRKIKIRLSNNAVIIIPSDKAKPCNELLDEILKINPSIVVEKK